MKWKTEKRKISDLKECEYNPRQLTKKQYKDLKSSLDKFGLCEIPVINTDNTIIAGHQRIKILKEKSPDVEIEVRVPFKKLNKEQFDEYLIRSNKNTGEWDWDTLANSFEMDALYEFGFEPIDFGFDLTNLEPEETKGDDDVPETKSKTITVKGDLYELGEHRLLCGDSTMIDDVEKLMDGEKADMVFTDPPYNINFKPQRATHDIIKNDNMNNDDFCVFLESIFKNAKIVLSDDSYLITFMGWLTIPFFKKSIEPIFEIKSMPIWVKNNFGIGYYTRPQYEPFYLCLNGNPKKPKTPPSDVFNYARVHKTIHSCEKPVGLILNIISNFIGRGLIFDPFLGSGSTLIACEKTNRKCYGMELEPKYCDVIVKRYIDFCMTNNRPFSVKRNGKEIGDFK